MTDSIPVKLELSLPGNLNFLETALHYIVNCAKVFDFSKTEIAEIQLAAEEALVNVINNALNNDPAEKYTIICQQLPTRMEIVIHDKGLPFSADETPDFNPEIPDNQENAEGLSMYLLKHSVDEVHFRNLGRNGKETVLIKNIAAQRIDNIIKNEVATKSSKKDGLKTSLTTEWHLRSFIPEDALEISRCAYHAYGYTYETYIYYPERITEMNQKGELQSVLAVDRNENILAHIALKFYHPDDPVAEIGVAFVNPKYRKLNIFNKLCLNAFAKAKMKGLQGLYGRAVTSHPLSQKALNGFGFIDSGVLLGLFPADVDFKKLTGKVVQKESALLMFLPIKSPTRAIFPPAKHAKIIIDIFARGNIGIKVCETQDCNRNQNGVASDLADTPKLSYSRAEVFNTADLICFSGNREIVPEILAAKKRLCLERTDVLYLFLDLENPGSAEIAEDCAEMGFFFAGILPYGMHGRHTLILQYLNNLAIDFNLIKLHTPFAGKLLEYVKISQQNTL